MTSPASVASHYQLCCYVCGPGCTKPSPFEGWATFEQIVINRPNNCRFAVGRRVPFNLVMEVPDSPTLTMKVSVAQPTGEFLVWDLFSIPSPPANRRTLLQPPEPVWTGPNEESMTMKAMMLYDHVE